MSKFLSFLFGLLLLGALGLAAAGWWVHEEFKKDGPLEKPVLVQIPRGAHIGGATDMLVYQGVISSYPIFKNMAKISGKAEDIKAGEYQFQPKVSMAEVLSQITEGRTFNRSVTVREGLTVYEIGQLLSQVDDLEQTPMAITPPEGRLLPETYSYSNGDTTTDIINRMAAALDEALDAAWEKRVDDLPIKTKEEALILASIIEKETAVPSERRRVAGVFINRLRKGMLLQTDPTVIYALTKGQHEDKGQGPLGRRLLRKDLKIDSPYNTYLYPGLPPTPIANPGKASIEAAVNPEQHDYLYFVADGTGGHIFSRTLDEHNRAVAKWRKIRASQ